MGVLENMPSNYSVLLETQMLMSGSVNKSSEDMETQLSDAYLLN